MKIPFFKYQGAGNDFIMIDDRESTFPSDNNQLVAFLCDRHFGIGADGLILLQNDVMMPYRMVYYNSDGKEGSMCGNGGRCFGAFVHDLGLVSDTLFFNAADGEHWAIKTGETVQLNLKNVDKIEEIDERNYFLNTGSPHHVRFVDDLHIYPVVEKGREIRNTEKYKAIGGTNVNFVTVQNNTLYIRTYERGVEDETLACGTGITAAAIAMDKAEILTSPVRVKARGGELTVYFKKTDNGYENIILEGPASYVFAGSVDV